MGRGDIEHWLAAPTRDRVIQLALWITAGLLTYGGLMLVLGVRPAQMLLRKTMTQGRVEYGAEGCKTGRCSQR